MSSMLQDVKWLCSIDRKYMVYVGLIIFGLIASVIGLAGMFYYGVILGW